MPRRSSIVRRSLGVAGLLVVVATFYWLIVWLAEQGPQLELNQLLLPLLAMTLIVLVLGLAGVLIRNLVRLIIERKRGMLGSRLRTKLVFFFLALVLLPALVLFSGSAQLIKRTVEGMLRTPVEEIHDESKSIVDAWSDHLEADCLGRAKAIARQVDARGYLSRERRGTLRRWVEERRKQEQLDWIRVTSASRRIAETRDDEVFADPAERAEQTGRLVELVDTVRERRTPVSRIDRLGERLVVHAAAPIGADDSADGAIAGVVTVSLALPTDMAQRMARIAAGKTNFNNFRRQRGDLLRLYLYLIALIFLVTVFVATWLGFYIARRITVPIQELAAATREVAAGNLGIRVRTEVGDEVGTLVESFNQMAAELQENREVITRSTADLRRSNRALDERRRYIETLIASISTAVISLDSEGRVTTANPAVSAILGLGVQAGEPLRPALERHGLDPIVSLLDHTLEHGMESSRKDLSIVAPTGTLNLAVQVTPLRGAAGEDLGTLLMVEDLTDLLRAQRAAAWREMARRIAHEIKNPLTPIQLSAQRLRKKFFERSQDLDEVLPEATASIEREVFALQQLVDEFSRFARLPEVRPQPVAFREVVDSVVGLYRGQPDIEWEVDIGHDLGTVMVDAQQMRRVLINLIDNGLAAMEGHGTIRVTARRYAGPGSLRIEVADSGPGIPVGDRDKMFAPYFSTKRRGTGLGLAIVHRVVTDHRGTIRIEENQPQGARFVIEIPA
jgi:two-component system nitrogen regulation sensor histidine kinase NtrY